MCAKKLILRTVFAILGIAIFLLLGFGALAIYSVPHETHNVSDYTKLLGRWDQKLVGHFPAVIPADASFKKFTHFPGFLQGSAYIQLRLRLPPEHIRQLHTRFSMQRTKSFFGGDFNQHGNEKEGMRTTFFRTSDTEDQSFPTDYEVMIFDPILPESERQSGYWNHGRSHGVAISTDRNEIVYWAVAW